MLKFENTAEVGDSIKAFDFEPMKSRGDSYLEGIVTAKGMCNHGFQAFTIKVTKKVSSGETKEVPPNMKSYIPYQVSFLEYDNRISKIMETLT
ncbi:MAG: hypothetical protein COA84_13145 [Robiginitomaculum sp.]|nr:MAG: hypothetical protein COA84_13145 [Robiginitomaculum sp.]